MRIFLGSDSLHAARSIHSHHHALPALVHRAVVESAGSWDAIRGDAHERPKLTVGDATVAVEVRGASRGPSATLREKTPLFDAGLFVHLGVPALVDTKVPTCARREAIERSISPGVVNFVPPGFRATSM